METKTITTTSGNTYELRKIVASFPGHCRICNQPIRVGEEIWYHKQVKISHVACPTVAPAVKDNAKSQVTNNEPAHEIARNRRADYCNRCGHLVPPGEGELVHLTDEEDIDFLGQGKTWIVYHIDKVLCDTNIETDKQAKIAKEAHEAMLRNERAELIKRIMATGLQECQDWSWDDYRYSFGAEIDHSEHYTAYEYYDSYPGLEKVQIGFAIKERKTQ